MEALEPLLMGGPHLFNTSSCSSDNYEDLSYSSGTCRREEASASLRRESESYVAVKGQSLIVTRSEGQKRGLCRRPSAVALNGPPSQSSGMNNFPEDSKVDQSISSICSQEIQTMSEIERHLHQMTQLLRPEDSIKLVVRLESLVAARIRYLAVVSCMEQETEEYCLLGMDCNGSITLGLVVAILSHTKIRLDGDGGFCVKDGDGLRSHIFKPVSVQTMWSALQTLYRANECAKQNNSYQLSAVKYYESLYQTNKSDTGHLNEWNTLHGVENRRQIGTSLSSEDVLFQNKISSSLREILIAEKDLDEVTSKQIRTKLELKQGMDLYGYKSFIDEEMLKILGQLDAPTKISDNLYLGTEWNASHEQDLFDKEIGSILNVTAEIDNFFPEHFRYMNIPVCDSEETDLLRYFNASYKFISEAHKEGKNVLVHCKMGISRSATIVIAFVMKSNHWELSRSIKHVKERRTCVKPNPHFMKQLEVYEGILNAKRFSNVLEKRSKSESNLKQGDFILRARNKSNLSSSNNSFSNLFMSKKSTKKYYNTAPARLKPQKYLRIIPSLSRSKSYSCATISIESDKDESSSEELVPRDVMESFQNAVQNLEQFPNSHSNLNSDNTLEKSSQPSKLPGQNDYTHMSFPPIPPANHGENPSSFTSQKTLVISPEPTEVESKLNIQIQIDYVDSEVPKNDQDQVDASIDEEMSGMVNWSTNNDNEFSNERKPIISAKSNLKSCRHPFNGHTFSVSPNQVMNITSLVDPSKFSVRHLVSEFELHSNRNSFSSIENSVFASPGYPISLSEGLAICPSGVVKSPVPINKSSQETLGVNKATTSSSSIAIPIKPTPPPRLSPETVFKSQVSVVIPNPKPVPPPRSSPETVIKTPGTTMYGIKPLPPPRSSPEAIAKTFVPSGLGLSISPPSILKNLNFERTLSEPSFDTSTTMDSSTGIEVTDLKQNMISTSSEDVTSGSFYSQCPPFLRNHFTQDEPTTIQSAVKSSTGKLSKSHLKKSSDPTRSRDKVRGSKSRVKLNHSIVDNKTETSMPCAVSESGDCIQPCANFSCVRQPSGVVRKRLEVFEAKSIPTSAEHISSNNRSHQRSQSATGNALSPVLLQPPETNYTPGHQRKSSMPHLISPSLSPSLDSRTNPLVEFSSLSGERKGSLDSSSLLKCLPNMSRRPLTVRGFQSSVNTKASFATNRHRGNAFGYNISNSGVKQEHGSTHPLNLLPQSAKLSQ